MDIKNKIKILIIISLCYINFSCDKIGSKIITEERSCGVITHVDAYENIDVIFTTNIQNKIKISAPKNLINKIETSIEGTALTIRNNNTFNWLHDLDPDITVWINCDSLSHFNFYGNSYITTETPIYCDTFHCEIGKPDVGSNGIINLEVYAYKLEVLQNDGYSDITFGGNARYLYIVNNSYGPMNFSNLIANFVFLYNHGSNNTYVHPLELLHGYATGVGDIYYYGQPTTINFELLGEGKLIPIE